MNTCLLRCWFVVLTFLTAARAADVVNNTANASFSQMSTALGMLAQAFDTGPVAVPLQSISVRLQNNNGNSNASVQLWTGAGAVPETLVENLGNTGDFNNTADALYTVASPTRPLLAANTRYWVVVQRASTTGTFFWRNSNSTAPAGTGSGATLPSVRANNLDGTSWTPFGTDNRQIVAVTSPTLVVLNTDDSGTGSLRQAVADAQTSPGPDTILFDPSLSGKTITLTSGEIVLNTDVTIDATALPGGITVSGNNASRIFFVDGATVSLHGLTLTRGNGNGFSDGGAILNRNDGTLTLTRCTLTGNSAEFGGAIFSSTASVTGPITTSTTLVRCTLSGNTASERGGAIENDRGRTTLTHCTVTGNTAPDTKGSGVASFGGNSTETVVQGSIISGNTASSVDFVQGDTNSFTSLGSNLIGSGNAIGDFNQAGDVINNTPLLAALGNYGGPTRTMPPLSTSPARDAALGFPGATDQRGLAIGDYVYENDFATGSLNGANVVLFNAAAGAGTVNGGSFLLTPAAQSQVVSLVLPEPGTFRTFAASFDLRYTDPSGGTGNGGPADGMSFSFGPKPPAGLYNGEDGPPGAHRVSFNIFNSNGGVGRLKYIRPNGTEGAAMDFPRFGDAGDFRAFTVTLDTAGTLRVTYKGALVFTVPNIGYSYQSGDTFTFAARTGGDVSEQRVDNIGIVTNPPEGRPDIGAVEGGLFPAGFAPVVTSNADTFGTGTGGLTLREALDLAPAGSTITFDPAVFTGATPATNTITLASDLPNLTRDVTIDATALPVGVTISGNNARGIFNVNGSGGSPAIGLLGLTFTGGNSGFAGGAINNRGGTLTLTRCTLYGNAADFLGGAIASRDSGASLVLTQCTLTGNSVVNNGVGGGAIYAVGILTLRHCTISGNRTPDLGGGVFADTGGTFTLENSIVSGNTPAGASTTDIFNAATLTRVGANIVQALGGSAPVGAGTIIPAAPKLAPLGNYGGPTQTMPPLFDSPALDAAVDSAETTDQRGLPRAVDADGDGTAVADLGAVELQVRLVTTTADENDGIGVGGVSLREAIADTSGASDIVRFDPAVFNAVAPATNTISLGPPLSSSHSITVSNRLVAVDARDIPAGVTIDDGTSTNYGLFSVTSGSILAFHGLTLANAGPLISGGGAVLVDANGTLTLDRCTLSGNEAIILPAFGGAIQNSGILALTRCTLTANSADSGGAIANFGTLTLTHCTLTGNAATAGQGSGVVSIGNSVTETVVRSCIISGNTNSSVDFMLGSTNTFTSLGGNLIGSGNATGDFNQSGDVINNSPLVAPLASNGGPTQTHALLPGSLARNASSGSTATTDQRGFPILGTADIGAYETQIGPIANATIDEDTDTGALGFTVGMVGTLSFSSGNTALVPDANIVPDGNSITLTPAPDANGGATITLTDSLTGETQSFFVLVLAVNDPPVFTAGPKQFVFVDSGAKTVNGWATGIAPGPADESAQMLGFNLSNDNNALFAAQPAIAPDGTLSFTPAAGVTGRATVTVSLSDNGVPVATSAEQTFTIAVRLLNPRSTVLLAKGSPAPGAGVFPGLPGDAVLASFRPPATSDAGDVAFVAKWTSATGPVKRGTGLFLNNTCLAVVGGDASAVGGTNAKWRSFTDPVVSEGHVACIARLSTGASAVVSNLTGAALEKIALSGEAATGVGGAKFRSFKSVTVLGARVAFLAQLATGSGTPRVTAGSDFGLWYHEPGNPLFVVRESDVVAGRTIRTLVAFKAGNGSPGAGRGTMVLSTISGDPVVGALAFFTDGTRGIISQNIDDGPPSLAVSLSGDAATGVDNGATFASYGVPARNADETTAFLAKLTIGAGVTRADASGIFTGPDGAGKFKTVIRTGVNAVSGAKFSLLKDPVLASDGALAFPATIRGGTVRGAAMQTLWTKRPGQPLALLAQGGADAAELPGSKWKAFKSLAITADRGPIFTATLAPRGSGVWANDFTGALRVLFNTGGDVGGKTVKSFKLLTATRGSTGVTRSFNDNGQLVWLATFTDKTTAIVVTEVP